MEKQPEYISLNVMKQLYGDWKHYLLQKKKKIIGIMSGFLFLCIAYSFISTPKYTAQLSFVMQSEDFGDEFSNLACQFGFCMSEGSVRAFGGDNLFELLISRMMVEKALLKPDTLNGNLTNLMQLYIQTYGMDKKWKKSDQPELQHLSFPALQDRNQFTRTQDSILQKTCAYILKKQLTVEKRSKKLSFGDITFTSKNEVLSKRFVENLMSEAGDYYIQIKSKRSRDDYNRLHHEVDSIRAAYAAAINSRASAVDNTPNPIRQTASVNVIQKTTEMQYLAATYAEMKKNLELAKVSMDNNIPIIDVIDTPRYPLIKERFGLSKAGVTGIFGGSFLGIGYYSLLFYRIKKKRIKPLTTE